MALIPVLVRTLMGGRRRGGGRQCGHSLHEGGRPVRKIRPRPLHGEGFSLHLCEKKDDMANENLRKAKEAKKDEFYTQLTDIVAELKHYRPLFRGKTVLCNCDDPYESNFFKYFALSFNDLGLRRLICTCYDGSPVAGRELPLFGDDPDTPARTACKIVLDSVSDANGDGATDLHDVELLLRQNPPGRLRGNGDFRSSECTELLREADIVVTNPPFSLFREYVAQLVRHGKKFLIIGSQNAITYKEIFPLIKENKLWLGYSIHSGDREFEVPKDYPLAAAGCRVDEKGRKFIRVKGVRWFTNLEHNKRHEKLDLYKHYSPEEFPKYDNYDAIEVSRTADIPMDYDGAMGVPITFLDKYCPEQFEILGATESEGKGFSGGLWDERSRVAQPVVGGSRVYKRIFIRRRK